LNLEDKISCLSILSVFVMKPVKSSAHACIINV
jgi:hypothetical protein